MSIATLARKSRAQRGAGRRSGWTLATTKSGNCPGPCGGGAPAQQHSFRRLMKNKQQGGGAKSSGANDASGGNCCFTTWKKTNDPKGEQSIGYYLWRKKQLTHNCIKHCIPHRGHYNPATPVQLYVQAEGILWVQNEDLAGIGLGGSDPLALKDIDLGTASGTYTRILGVRVEATQAAFKEGDVPATTMNFPESEIWVGPAFTSTTRWVITNCCYAVADEANKWEFMLINATSLRAPPWQSPFVFYEYYDSETKTSYGDNGVVFFTAPKSSRPPESGWVLEDPEELTCSGSCTISIQYPRTVKACTHAACDSDGCKCNCNKSMGGPACCIVHKTMLPLSNSENIAWVVEDRTCLQTSKPNPRNPNTC